MRIVDLITDSRTINVNGLSVSYAPSNISGATMRDLAQLTELSGVESIPAIAKCINALVIKWDLEDNDGRPVGLDIGSLDTVPVVILALVLGAVWDDLQPKKATGNAPLKTSSGQSSRKGPKA